MVQSGGVASTMSEAHMEKLVAETFLGVSPKMARGLRREVDLVTVLKMEELAVPEDL